MPKIVYLNEHGVEVPSTTTIINKYKDMGGLLHYAHSEGRAGRGLNESRDRAGDIGSMLHGMIEAYVRGDQWEMPPEPIKTEDLEISRRLFDTFIKWWAVNDTIIVEATETSLVSEEHQYGGTIDLVATILGQPFLLDWKTSKDYYQEMLLQMAAYRALWRERKAQDIRGAKLVLFSKTSRKLTVYPVSDEQMDLAFPKFLLLRKTYDMEAAIANSVKETRRAAVSYDYSS